MPRARLLTQVRAAIRLRHYSLRTEEAYVRWIRRFVLFHQKRHPRELGASQVRDFLSHLATERNVSASTRNQALAALLFLYRSVLEVDLPLVPEVVRARRPGRLPTVLSPEEVQRVLAGLHGAPRLVAGLLYGSGLRLLEALRLRVKDLDFEMHQLVVREGKGLRDRVSVLPDRLAPSLAEHLQRVGRLHQRDLSEGFGAVHLPFALEEKYPGAATSWGWQYVFPARTRSTDPRGGPARRHHLSEASVQNAVRRAVGRAGLSKPASCHTLRHAFATHLLQDGYDIRTVRDLLGHGDARTTLLHTLLLHRGGRAVRSPLDGEEPYTSC